MKAGIIVLPQAVRAAIIFALLIALMLTGMPVSIALGLTVLTLPVHADRRADRSGRR